jgi:hypothetical protein
MTSDDAKLKIPLLRDFFWNELLEFFVAMPACPPADQDQAEQHHCEHFRFWQFGNLARLGGDRARGHHQVGTRREAGNWRSVDGRAFEFDKGSLGRARQAGCQRNTKGKFFHDVSLFLLILTQCADIMVHCSEKYLDRMPFLHRI